MAPHPSGGDKNTAVMSVARFFERAPRQLNTRIHSIEEVSLGVRISPLQSTRRSWLRAQ